MPPEIFAEKPDVLLTIAGFDPSSGAGASADLQVFAAHGYFGTACLTALTVQSTLGVRRVEPVDASLLREMLRCLAEDLPPSGIKVGMLGNAAVLDVVTDFLDEQRGLRPLPVVLDPVLRASSGHLLFQADPALLHGQARLFRSTCITPNREELALLTGRSSLRQDQVVEAAQQMLEETRAQSVIVTGGEEAQPDDLVLERGKPPVWIRGDRIDTTATHGTGCAFSSAILSHLVGGADLLTAVQQAKRYVEQSLRFAPGLGHGKGPMHLGRPLRDAGGEAD